MHPLSGIRNEYTGGPFGEENAGSDPMVLFGKWLEEALRSGNPEPSAMSLATADKSGKVSSRMVLLKEAGPGGFVFFTNYNSRKGKEIEANPMAALLFFWPELYRQVRIEGILSILGEKESDEYFSTRPRNSRISAWASPQSEPIPGRVFLDTREKEMKSAFEGKPVPRPPWWGGYLLRPETIEFWQGRENRLHDRIRYTQVSGDWKRERLAP